LAKEKEEAPKALTKNIFADKLLRNRLKKSKEEVEFDLATRKEVQKIIDDVIPRRASFYLWLLSYSDSYTFVVRPKELTQPLEDLRKGEVVYKN